MKKMEKTVCCTYVLVCTIAMLFSYACYPNKSIWDSIAMGIIATAPYLLIIKVMITRHRYITILATVAIVILSLCALCKPVNVETETVTGIISDLFTLFLFAIYILGFFQAKKLKEEDEEKE